MDSARGDCSFAYPVGECQHALMHKWDYTFGIMYVGKILKDVIDM